METEVGERMLNFIFEHMYGLLDLSFWGIVIFTASRSGSSVDSAELCIAGVFSRLALADYRNGYS